METKYILLQLFIIQSTLTALAVRRAVEDLQNGKVRKVLALLEEEKDEATKEKGA